MKMIEWNLKQISSESDFQEMLQKQMSFPYYYGRNPDAFWDCITDIVEPTTINITGYGFLEKKLKSEVDKYIELCHDYSRKSKGLLHICIL